MKIKKLLLLTLLFSGLSVAKDYPEKPVTIVVPYGAGGASDLAARAISETAPKYLDGQSVMVVNKKGNSGVIGSRFVSESKPDGYTLLLARPVVSLYPAINPKSKVKWDDYSFIGSLESTAFILVVNSDSPYKTPEDLFAAIEKNPGKLSYAASGPTAIDGLSAQALLTDNNLDPLTSATLVPYDGGSAMATALLGNHIDFLANAASSLIPHIESGKLRPLVVLSPKRIPALPDVPTATELGYKKAGEITGWSALYGPKDLPDNVVKTWQEVLNQLASDEDWLRLAAQRGALSNVGELDQAAFAKSQYELFKGLAKEFGYTK